MFSLDDRPLYIEMAYLNVNGDLLKDQARQVLLRLRNLSITTAVGIFLGKKDKRTRFAHQLSLAIHSRIAQDVFEEQNGFSDVND